MFKTIRVAAIALSVGTLMTSSVACDAAEGATEPVANAALYGPWTLGPVATCGQLGLVSIRVHASLEGSDPVSRAEPCDSDARDGLIFIDALDAGTWTLTFEGVDAEGEATHQGEAVPIVIVDPGEQASADEVLLLRRPADVIVDWTVGGKCGSAGIVDVLVELYDAQGRPLDGVGPLLVDCDASFFDPRDSLERTGVLFPGVPAEPGVTALVRGFGPEGAAIWRGDEGPLDLFPGRLTELLVELAPCAGDPPDCD